MGITIKNSIQTVIGKKPLSKGKILMAVFFFPSRLAISQDSFTAHVAGGRGI